MKDIYQQISSLIEFIIEHKLEGKTLEEIADSAGISISHVQRLFTKWVGISPKQFARYLSLEYAKELLVKGKTIENTAMSTGLSGTGRLHDLFMDIESVTPGEYKARGKNIKINYYFYKSPFGKCLVATTDRGVCNVLFGDTEKQILSDLSERWPEARFEQQANKMQKVVANYINGIDKNKKIKLHLQGTNFQLKVWEALLSIPDGSVTSYGDIAKRINLPTHSRAVGSAVGDNPIGYIIPCHRVIKSTGEISGYHWGMIRKRTMLGYEAMKKNRNLE